MYYITAPILRTVYLVSCSIYISCLTPSHSVPTPLPPPRVMAGSKPRGGKAGSNASRAVIPPSASSSDQPLPTPRPATRATRSTTSRSSTLQANAKKRGVPDEDASLTAKPPKNPKKVSSFSLRLPATGT